MHDTISRRTVFAAGALAAFAGIAGPAAAAETAHPTDAEKANLKIVQAFCDGWSVKDYDPDKLMPKYIAEDGKVRFTQSMPFMTGPASVATASKSYMSHGERFKMKILSTYVRGPIVVTHRIDTLIAPGKPDQDMEIVGVFLMKDGKIKEWTDYEV